MQLIYRIIYHPLINPILRSINKFLAPLLPKSIRIPPSGILTVKLSNTRFKFLTNQTNYTSQILFWKGVYAMEYTSIFERVINKFECFYDIGSHAGYYSLIAVAQNPRIRVIAFEPATGPFYYLSKNIMLNGFSNQAHAYPFAIGHFNGETEFLEATHHKYHYLEHNLLAIGNLQEEKPGRVMKKVKVQLLTLDTFIAKYNEPYPDIIKMDTEGTEHLILESCPRVLEHRPIIICETLFNKIEDKLEKIMGQRGYHFYNHKEGKLHRVETIIRSIDDGVRDCFFIPPEKTSMFAEFIFTID